MSGLRTFFRWAGFLIAIPVLIVLALVFFLSKDETIDYSTFIKKLESNQVRDLELRADSEEIYGTYQNDKSFYVYIPNNTSPQFLKMVKEHGVKVFLDYRLIQ